MPELVELPSPSVETGIAFLFTDVQGSTRLWEAHPNLMREALARHDRILAEAIRGNGGRVFKTIGDAFCAAFPTVRGAAKAALDAQQNLQRETPDVRVRMAIHLGRAQERDDDFFGPALNRVSRLLAAGHGGQVLLTREAALTLENNKGFTVRRLGLHRLRDIAELEEIHQLDAPGAETQFPALATEDVIFRRGLIRSALIASMVIAALGVLSIFAWGQKSLAQSRAIAVAKQREATRTQLYISDENRALAALRAGNVSLAQTILEAQIPQPGDTDLRGWEWRYLSRRVQLGDALTSTPVPGSATSLAYSPDRRLVAVTLSDGKVWLRRLNTGQVRVLSGHRGAALCSAFSPKGDLLATGGKDGDLRLWNSSTGTPYGSPRRHAQAVTGVAFSPDGAYLAAGIDFDAPRLRMATAEETRSMSRVYFWPTEGSSGYTLALDGAQGVRAVAFSPDGRYLAAGCFDPDLRMIDLRTGRVSRLHGHVGSIQSLCFSPTGGLLVSGGFDTAIRLWDASNLEAPSREVRGHTGVVRSVAFSADGTMMVSASDDSSLRAWDLPSSRFAAPRAVLSGHTKSVCGGVAIDGSERLISAGEDGTVRTWSPTNKDGAQIVARSGGDAHISVSPDSRLLAVSGADQRLTVWDLQKGSRSLGPWKLAGAGGRVAFSPDGRYLASTTGGWSQSPAVKNQLVVRDLSKGGRARLLVGNSPSFSTVAFSPDGRLLACGDIRGILRTWDTETWTPETPKAFSPSVLIHLAFVPHINTLIAVDFTGNVIRWDTLSGKLIDRSKRFDTTVFCADLTPDGSWLAAGGFGGVMQLIRLDAPGKAVTLRSSQNAAGCSFSADGKTLAVSEPGGLIRLWSLRAESPAQVADLDAGAPLLLSRPTFSADGESLASACADGSVRIWRALPLAR